MNYYAWGREYQEEARRIKAYLVPLRQELKTAAGEQLILLGRRVYLLGEIYLECMRTGQYLIEKGESFHEEQTGSEP